MKIYKVINNNVLSAFDEQNQEIVIMGRGIGFKAKQGDQIDENKIEKVFCIENSTLSRQFQDLISNMPLEHMQISADIISYAKNECGMKLNQSIYIALTDHINFALERYSKGVQLPNALLWEIRQFYRREYLVGEYALRLIGERLDMHFSEDEAGFIALHFVNAEYDTDVHDTYAITNMMKQCVDIIRQEITEPIDETSMHYERFISHMKFFARRLVFSGELLQDEDPEMADIIERKYPKEFACAKKVMECIENENQCKVTREETMYLAIHIRRIHLNAEK